LLTHRANVLDVQSFVRQKTKLVRGRFAKIIFRFLMLPTSKNGFFFVLFLPLKKQKLRSYAILSRIGILGYYFMLRMKDFF
jgi:hypothetical protein